MAALGYEYQYLAQDEQPPPEYHDVVRAQQQSLQPSAPPDETKVEGVGGQLVMATPLQETTIIVAQPVAPVVAQPIVQHSVLVTTETLFGPTPVLTTCRNCAYTGETETSWEPSGAAWLMCFLLCIFGCYLCCFIPAVLPGGRDTEHRCARCKVKLGVHLGWVF